MAYDREYPGRRSVAGSSRRDKYPAGNIHTTTRRSDRRTAPARGQNKNILAQVLSPVKNPVDYPFLIAVCLLVAFGLMMLFSAGSAKAFANYGDTLYYFKNQLVGAILGIAGMYFCSKIDYHSLRHWALILYVACGVLLVMVLIPGLGTTSGGATRWLFGFQPSEIAKFALILFVSVWVERNQQYMPSFMKGFMPCMIMLAIYVVLLIFEPHFSCIILMTLTVMLILFVGGAKIKHFFYIGLPGVLGAAVMILIEPYRMARVVSFMDPFADVQGSGWQIVQSLYAIGSGGLFGVGLGQSRQKFQSLPEPQNDFIFSVLAEELGLIGALVLIGLFIFLIYRGVKIASKAPDLFGTLLTAGIIGIIAFQAVINIAVVTSSVPVTGMPLPFFSYGSTALIITMCEIGVVLNVSRQCEKI